MTEIVAFQNHERPDLAHLTREIRRIVFIEGQQVTPDLEYEYEEEAHHYILFEDGKAVATARWRETDKGIKLERFATLKEFRGKGFGAALLQGILKSVIPLNKPIYLHSQADAQNFYEQFGFVKTGNLFSEANIPHYFMYYAPESK